MSLYDLSYTAIAVTVSTATLSGAMAAVPIPMDPLNALGLVVTADNTAPSGGPDVTRTITLQSTVGPLPANQVEPGLRKYMKDVLARALVCPIQAATIVVH